MLMQDNAPPHTCHYAMKFFKANDIPVMSCPSASSDLNPIENIWDIIDDRLKIIRPRNLKELQSMIQQIWDNITEETWLIRCLVVLKAVNVSREEQCINID